jgi:DNA polymerase III subunit alpha
LGYIGNRSVFSFLKSTLTIENLIVEMKKRQYETVILTDDHLHGVLSFFDIAKKHHIKPIFTQKVVVVDEHIQYDVILGIKNQTGYLNMLKLNQFMQESPITIDLLKANQEGLSITFYRIQNIFDDTLYMTLFSQFMKQFQMIYMSVSFQSDEDDTFYTPLHEKISQIYGVSLVLVHISHHIDSTDLEASQHLHLIGNHKYPEGQFQLLSKHAIDQIFQSHPYLKKHMDDYIKLHSFDLIFPQFNLPQIPLEKGITSQAYLQSLAYVGLKKRFKNKDHSQIHTYESRLQYELSVITSLGFEDYFLVVYDIIKYAKTHDIYVGPGRGSVAGSLVAYVLGITEVDPIYYDLLFERFLNPERMSMPDIDMDFPDDKRDEVILYAQSRFGSSHIASIVTYQTFGKKSAIRDLSKIFQFSAPRIQAFTEAIMKDDIDQQDHDMVTLYEAVKKIEGLPRQTGTHAAGVILSKEPLDQWIPLSKGPYPFYQTQFEAKELESIGLLKMDFLGIRNLKIIDDVKKEIQKNQPDFSLTKIPYDDSKTYALLTQASTDGIFQLESYGMRQVLRQLKPTMFEDIVALLALYRPGPMAFIDMYVERRHGQSYQHMHPSFEPFLKSTYGIIIYQEQIMQIAQAFAGYSLAEADLLRRGISKKDEALLKSEADRFIFKAIQNGQSEKDATDVYDLIVRFSDYGFNRSHSVSYAIVAYQMAYLKANYYIYFMQALLNSVIGSEKAIHDYMKDLSTHHITLLPPHILNSNEEFQIIDQSHILAPLTIVKSIGHKTVVQILNHKHTHTLETWIQIKTWLKEHLSERQLIQMIHAGCFDYLTFNRRTLVEHISFNDIEYMEYLDVVKMTVYDEYDEDTLSQLEKEALGFNMRFDPNVHLQNIQTCYLSDIQVANDIVARIISTKNIKTKNNEDMAFLSCHDGREAFELTVFPKTYEKYGYLIEKGMYKINVMRQTYKEKVSYIGQSFDKIEKK